MATYKHKIRIEDGDNYVEFQCVTNRYHYSADTIGILGNDLKNLGYDMFNRITATGNWGSVGNLNAVYGWDNYLFVANNIDQRQSITLSEDAVFTDDNSLVDNPLDTTIEANMRRLFDVKDKFKKRAIKAELPIDDSTPFIDYPDIIIKESSNNRPPNEDDDIVFYDYDGTPLYSYSVAEIQEMTELPLPPDHSDENLTFDGWNWDLADLKAENRPNDVGAMYYTTDGFTEIHIQQTNTFTFQIMVYTALNTATITIDWGDGTIEDYSDVISSNGTIAKLKPTHNYTNIGNYVVKFHSDLDWSFATDGSNYSFVGYNDFSVTKIKTSRNIRRLYSNDLYRMRSLEYIIYPNNVDCYMAFYMSTSLKVFFFPNSTPSNYITTLGSSLFYSCPILEKVIFSPKVCKPNYQIKPSSFLQNAYRIKRFVYPKQVSETYYSNFEGSYIESIYFPNISVWTSKMGETAISNLKLIDIRLCTNPPTSSANLFGTMSYAKKIKINIKRGTYDLYANDEYWGALVQYGCFVEVD